MRFWNLGPNFRQYRKLRATGRVTTISSKNDERELLAFEKCLQVSGKSNWSQKEVSVWKLTDRNISQREVIYHPMRNLHLPFQSRTSLALDEGYSREWIQTRSITSDLNSSSKKVWKVTKTCRLQSLIIEWPSWAGKWHRKMLTVGIRNFSRNLSRNHWGQRGKTGARRTLLNNNVRLFKSRESLHSYGVSRKWRDSWRLC